MAVVPLEAVEAAAGAAEEDDAEVKAGPPARAPTSPSAALAGASESGASPETRRERLAPLLLDITPVGPKLLIGALDLRLAGARVRRAQRCARGGLSWWSIVP